MSRLVGGRTTHSRTKHHKQTYVCNSCLHPFYKKKPLERHILNCQRHLSQDVRYPDPEKPKECVAEFRNKAARFRLPFLSSLRFRILLDSPRRRRRRRRGQGDLSDRRAPLCGFACYRMTYYPQYQTDPFVYSGPDVINKFYDHIMSESGAIETILVDDQDMTQLTDRQQTDYDNATCGGVVSDSRGQTRRSDITII